MQNDGVGFADGLKNLIRHGLRRATFPKGEGTVGVGCADGFELPPALRATPLINAGGKAAAATD